MKLAPEAQCAANVRAWLTKHELGGQREFRLVESDRVWLPRDPGLEISLSQMCAQGLLEKRFAGNHGKNIVVAYREFVHRCAAQVIVHDDGIEIDFDKWQPFDLRGGIMHFFSEVLVNRWWKRKTDPFKIAAALKERGIHGDTAA